MMLAAHDKTISQEEIGSEVRTCPTTTMQQQ